MGKIVTFDKEVVRGSQTHQNVKNKLILVSQVVQLLSYEDKSKLTFLNNLRNLIAIKNHNTSQKLNDFLHDW